MKNEDIENQPKIMSVLQLDRQGLDEWLKTYLNETNPSASQRQKVKQLFLGERASYRGFILVNGETARKTNALATQTEKAKTRKSRDDKDKLRGSRKPYAIWIDHSQNRLRLALDMESEKISLYEIEESSNPLSPRKDVELICNYLDVIEEESGLTIVDGGNHVNRIMLTVENGQYGVGTVHWAAYATYKDKHYPHGEIAIIPKYGKEADDFFRRSDPYLFDPSSILKCKIRLTKRYNIVDITGVSYD